MGESVGVIICAARIVVKAHAAAAALVPAATATRAPYTASIAGAAQVAVAIRANNSMCTCMTCVMHCVCGPRLCAISCGNPM